MKEVVLKFDSKDKASLYSVRANRQLRAATEGDYIWLRGIDLAQRNQAPIRALPFIKNYLLDAQNNLFWEGNITPTDQLKELEWSVLVDFLPVTLPIAAMSGKMTDSIEITLVPSSHAVASIALLLSLENWKSYVETAPEIRFNKLRFAVAADERVLLVGTPLVPLPGQEFLNRGSLLLPNGYDLEQPLLAGLIEKRLNPQQDCFLMFHQDGTWEKIPKEYFVLATRSGVRFTEGRNVSE